jgi:hypothetical protein
MNNLQSSLRGELIQPGDANYDDARRLYNAMIDKKPRLIARCIDAADVIAFVTASESENPDLFWAVRGGGGNFGVVTGFTFRLSPVHTVIAGPIFWPVEDAPQIMRKYEPFITDAPEDLNGFFAFLTVPPASKPPTAKTTPASARSKPNTTPKTSSASIRTSTRRRAE